MIDMRTLGIVLVAAVGAGCGGKKSSPGSGSGSASTSPPSSPSGSATGSGPASGAAPDLPAPPPVDQAAARQVVDAWLAAQNSGDFAAYQAVYAARMEGVKRVGPRMSRFDRAGWLKDRERMFKHPMVVAVRDVTIGGSAAVPTVEFVQTFQQGKFSDEGTKRMVLTRSGAGFLIAREEMLSSNVGGPVAMGADPVGLVIAVDNRPFVVIQEGAAPAWGRGAIRGPYQGAHLMALRDADDAPAAASWKGKAIAVYDAAGKRCDATVSALRIAGGGTPHFGEVQGWDGQDGGTPWTPAQRAQAVYNMGPLYLVGELAVTGGCVPVAAMEPSARPTWFAPGGSSEAIASAAFRALPAYADLQKSWRDDYGGQGPWVKDVTYRGYVASGVEYAVVSAREGSGCGDFEGRLTAVFAIEQGVARLVSNPDDGAITVTAIVDSDGDGKVELLGAPDDFSTVTAHFTPIAGGFAPTASVSFPWNDCGC